ncbi:MAG: hypothetical protein WBA45_02075 [Microthrixaceae bacterium]
MRSDPTDPYRDALYSAEDAALPDGGRRFTRFSAIEKFIEEVIADPWWESTFPDAAVEVAVRRRSRGATFSAAHVAQGGQEAVLFIRDGSWTMAVVIHELAHVAANQYSDGGMAPSQGSGSRAFDGSSGSDASRGHQASHGPEFATALLILWRRYLGVHAYGALRSAFDEREVPYRRALRG